MSSTLERARSTGAGSADSPGPGGAAGSPAGSSRAGFELSTPGRILLAALSGVAGVIHLAMVPSHAGSSAVEGAGFALTGWVQVAIAVLVLTTPSRSLLRATMLVNVVALGAWAISRTAGLPFGEHPGQPHDAALVDLVCVGIEAALVACAAWWLSHPGAGRTWRGWALVGFSVVPVTVVALATVALASPSARDHAGSSHRAHGVDPAAAAVGSSPSAGHRHGSEPSAMSETVGLDGRRVEGVKALDVAAETQPDEPLDPATRALLAEQLVIARETALRFPTTTDATAAGYRLVGGFGPGAGAHYIGFSGLGGFDPSRPAALIYDGTSPTSRIVGLMYLGGATTAPEGFAGPNDHWHRHSGVCLEGADVLFPVDAGVTRDRCAAAGGLFMDRTTWMVHAWVVPAWESPAGVFSHENPNLRCADGTYDTDEIGRCEGS